MHFCCDPHAEAGHVLFEVPPANYTVDADNEKMRVHMNVLVVKQLLKFQAPVLQEVNPKHNAAKACFIFPIFFLTVTAAVPPLTFAGYCGACVLRAFLQQGQSGHAEHFGLHAAHAGTLRGDHGAPRLASASKAEAELWKVNPLISPKCPNQLRCAPPCQLPGGSFSARTATCRKSRSKSRGRPCRAKQAATCCTGTGAKAASSSDPTCSKTSSRLLRRKPTAPSPSLSC